MVLHVRVRGTTYTTSEGIGKTAIHLIHAYTEKEGRKNTLRLLQPHGTETRHRNILTLSGSQLYCRRLCLNPASPLPHSPFLSSAQAPTLAGLPTDPCSTHCHVLYRCLPHTLMPVTKLTKPTHTPDMSYSHSVINVTFILWGYPHSHV